MQHKKQGKVQIHTYTSKIRVSKIVTPKKSCFLKHESTCNYKSRFIQHRNGFNQAEK